MFLLSCFVNNFYLILYTLIGGIILSINIHVGLNIAIGISVYYMLLYDGIGDASLSLRGLTSSWELFLVSVQWWLVDWLAAAPPYALHFYYSHQMCQLCAPPHVWYISLPCWGATTWSFCFISFPSTSPSWVLASTPSTSLFQPLLFWSAIFYVKKQQGQSNAQFFEQNEVSQIAS